MKKILVLIILVINSFLFSFPEDEKLKFEIKYGVIKAGYATLEVDTLTFRDSEKCLSFTSNAKTNKFFDKIFKVRDKIESVWDKERKATLRFTKRLREGSYKQHRVHHYYPDLNKTVYIKYSKKKKTPKRKEMKIAKDTQDILSSFYYIRNQELVVGDTLAVNVTADGRNYSAKVLVHKKAKKETIFGKIDCFKIEPLLEGEGIFKQTGNIFIWLTADERKVPVLLESKIIFGSFRAVLKESNYVTNSKE